MIPGQYFNKATKRSRLLNYYGTKSGIGPDNLSKTPLEALGTYETDHVTTFNRIYDL